MTRRQIQAILDKAAGELDKAHQELCRAEELATGDGRERIERVIADLANLRESDLAKLRQSYARPLPLG